VLLLGGCTTIALLTVRTMKQTGLLPNVPKAAVVTGTPITWRELGSWSSNGGGMFGGSYGTTTLLTGDFDGDKQTDLLVPEEENFGGSHGGRKFTLYSLSGNERPLTIGGNSYYFQSCVWDYDGDGFDEVALLDGSQAYIFNTAGQQQATIPGGSSYGSAVTLADVDGDGRKELPLSDTLNPNKLNLTDYHGTIVGSVPTTGFGYTWGDIDGDGKDEKIEQGSIGGLESTGIGKAPVPVPGWLGQSFGATLQCIDLNGDGCDEIVDRTSGYLDVKAGKYTTLAVPATSNIMGGMPGMTTGTVAAGDFDGDGKVELACPGGSTGVAGEAGTALYLFKLDGTLKYHEEFGKELHSIAGVAYGNKTHLVVLLEDKLLITP
jgi:hypothetical protein